MKSLLAQWPYFDETQILVASEVLKSGRVNSWTGSETTAFEEEFATCVILAMPWLLLTALLLSAYLSIGLGSGDELITTPRTFIATSSSAVLLGATPIFADVDRNSGCLTAKSIEPLITTRTKAISVVHQGGWPADMREFVLWLSLTVSLLLKIVLKRTEHKFKDGVWRSVGSFGDVLLGVFVKIKLFPQRVRAVWLLHQIPVFGM